MVNGSFVTKARQRIDDYLAARESNDDPAPKPISYIMTHGPSTKWLVAELTRRGIAYMVIPLGAGAVHVTTDTHICKHCNGTGRGLRGK